MEMPKVLSMNTAEDGTVYKVLDGGFLQIEEVREGVKHIWHYQQIASDGEDWTQE